jgi:transposase InsO family protein
VEESRLEFCLLALQEGANVRGLCRRFGVHPSNAYMWLRRYREEGKAGLKNRSRAPHTSPGRCPLEVELAVLAVRESHPAWGGRKICARLLREGHAHVPSASTITQVLRRNGVSVGWQSAPSAPWQRFEREEPNLLLQMDFKGHFETAQGRCHPLTVLDDHSRFLVSLSACADERTGTVKEKLTGAFRRYGLPQAIMTDNGSPWGGGDAEHSLTPIGVWLMRLGVRVAHTRPYHPQTNGKDERLHRTLKTELLRGRYFSGLGECQVAFDAWRNCYNSERPHEALGMQTPASRYRPSPWPFPEQLPEVEYDERDEVRKVQATGIVSFHGRELQVPKALVGERVGIRPGREDGLFELRFCRQLLGSYDLRLESKPTIKCVHNVPEHL